MATVSYKKLDPHTISRTTPGSLLGLSHSKLVEIFNFKARKVFTLYEMKQIIHSYQDSVAHSGAGLHIQNFTELVDGWKDIEEMHRILIKKDGTPGELQLPESAQKRKTSIPFKTQGNP